MTYRFIKPTIDQSLLKSRLFFLFLFFSKCFCPARLQRQSVKRSKG